MLSLQRSFERASQTAAELPRIPQLEPLYRNLDNNTYRHVSSMYSQAMKGISEGIFVPHVTTLCKGCPVQDACWAVNGKNSYRYPVESTVQPPETNNKEKDTK